MTDYADFKTRQQQSVWHFLNRLMIALIVGASLIIIVCLFLPPLKQQREQAAHVEQLRADIDKQNLLLARRTREVDLLQHDRGYVELIARDRLDLMKEGETIYRVEQPRQDTTNFKRNAP